MYSGESLNSVAKDSLMEMRPLGKSSLKTAPIVFGGNVFGWTINEKQSFEILDAFIAGGFNMIDTADVYSRWVEGHHGGESEVILGNWMKARGNREKVLIATKVGMEMGADKKGLKKDYILRAVEDSLKRLKTDYIDLYQAHRDDESTPLEETLEAFDQLVKEGKVLAIGASNYGGARLREALRISQEKDLTAFSTLQPGYNLYDREKFEKDEEEVCLKNNVGVISYYSLASGFLSGKYRSEEDVNKSPRGQGVRQKYMNERGWKILKALDEVSHELDANPTQVALAWLIHRPSVTAPIVSATSVSQLQDLMRAPRLKLTQEQIQKLNQASS